jgi:hypothetical protein
MQPAGGQGTERPLSVGPAFKFPNSLSGMGLLRFLSLSLRQAIRLKTNLLLLYCEIFLNNNQKRTGMFGSDTLAKFQN